MSHTLGLVIQTLSAEAVESLKTFEQESEVVSASLHEYNTSSSMFSMVFSGIFLLLYIIHKTYVILR